MENSLKLIVGWKISPTPHYHSFAVPLFDGTV